MKKLLLFLIISLFSLTAQTNLHLGKEEIPHLEKRGNTFQLIVNENPFLMLAGETGNSSASRFKLYGENLA